VNDLKIMADGAGVFSMKEVGIVTGMSYIVQK
jgi:hypothetical protein